MFRDERDGRVQTAGPRDSCPICWTLSPKLSDNSLAYDCVRTPGGGGLSLEFWGILLLLTCVSQCVCVCLCVYVCECVFEFI